MLCCIRKAVGFVTNSERLFLLLADELHFCRAAEKAYISQQCLSDHIKRLEEQYGTPLFFRKPSIALTPAGESVQRTLLMVRQLEQGLALELEEIENGDRGTLRIGMNYTRARLIFPTFFTRYHPRYPNVRIEPVLEETRIMQELLTRGELDCFLGVNAQLAEPMAALPLTKERIFLVASGDFLRRRIGLTPEQLASGGTELVPRQLEGLPFILNPTVSTTYQLVEQYLRGQGITVNNIFSVSDYGITEQVSRQGHAAFFCPQMILPFALSGNQFAPEPQRLFALPVQGLLGELDSSLVYNGRAYRPKYTEDAFLLIRDIAQDCMEQSRRLLQPET